MIEERERTMKQTDILEELLKEANSEFNIEENEYVKQIR